VHQYEERSKIETHRSTLLQKQVQPRIQTPLASQRFTNCSASVNRHVYDKEFPPLGLPTSASAKLKLNSLPASATAKHSATRAEQVRGYVGC
jgi:hypothetical protein